MISVVFWVLLSVQLALVLTATSWTRGLRSLYQAIFSLLNVFVLAVLVTYVAVYVNMQKTLKLIQRDQQQDKETFEQLEK